MAHDKDEKKRLRNRVRRLRGQVDSVERALEHDKECSEVLHNISACRGAIDALMAEVIEVHMMSQVLPKKGKVTEEQAEAADDLVKALRAYLK